MAQLNSLIDNTFDKLIVLSYSNIGYYIRHQFWVEKDFCASLEGKVAIVTGANSGLGKATAKEFAQRGAKVYLLCRNRSRAENAVRGIIEETANTDVFYELVDMSSQRSIREFVKRFKAKNRSLDILVNNAGVLLDDKQLSEDKIEKTFATNTLGYFLLTNLLISTLENALSSRIINVSSGGMYAVKLNVDDPQFDKRKFDGLLAYAESKRAEVVLTKFWAEKLAHKGIFVSSMHPGWADTPAVERSLPRFWKVTRPILRTPEQGADTIVWLAAHPNLQLSDSGKFWFDRQARPLHTLLSTKSSRQEEEAFWNYCCRLTNWKDLFPTTTPR